MSVAQTKTRYWIAAAALGLALTAVIYLFPPAQYAFYPRCGFYALTGLQCPGCGGLRAMHCLLHGDFGAAFAYNPLLVLLAPVAGIIAAWLAIQRFRRKGAGGVSHGRTNAAFQPVWWWSLLVVALAFALWRNLTIAPGGSL